MPRRPTGVELKKLILRSRFLPDHPEPFRKKMVLNALEQEGVTTTSNMVDQSLKKLQMQGYLIRSEEEVGGFSSYYLYIFARPDRMSDRPGWRPGEKNDLWRKDA